MKAILIDPFTHIISEVEINRKGQDSCLKDILYFLHCDLIASVNINHKGSTFRDVMFVSDTGLYEHPHNQNHQAYFSCEWYPDLLAGYGIIVGTDREGETTETSLTLKEVTNAIIAWTPML